MAWIESHQSLRSHPKTRKLARLLQTPDVVAIGHLHALWWWALDHAFDGDLSGYDPEDVAIGAGWEGDAEKFLAALVDCKGRSGSGFVDRTDAGLSLHDWEHYTAHLRARRESSAKANHARWHKSRGVFDPECTWCTDSDNDADGTDAESESNADGVRTDAERNPPYLTEPNQTEPNQESKPSRRKRRATALPEGWTPDGELRAWAGETYPLVDARLETQKFRNHAQANGRAQKDWRAAWRNWIINAGTKYATPNGQPPESDGHLDGADYVEQLEREREG